MEDALPRKLVVIPRRAVPAGSRDAGNPCAASQSACPWWQACGGVVGDEVDGAVEERFPQRVLVILAAEGRVGLADADEIGILGVREVVRARFDPDLVVALAPLAHLVESEA